MRYLIDTQILIWSLGDIQKLSPSAISILRREENDIFISIASLWEIAIKISVEKIKLPVPFEDFIEETLSNNFEILGIELVHLLTLTSLPFYHRDPFDRVIISQAISEKIAIVSSDEKFSFYNVEKIW